MTTPPKQSQQTIKVNKLEDVIGMPVTPVTEILISNHTLVSATPTVYQETIAVLKEAQTSGYVTVITDMHGLTIRPGPKVVNPGWVPSPGTTIPTGPSFGGTLYDTTLYERLTQPPGQDESEKEIFKNLRKMVLDTRQIIRNELNKPVTGVEDGSL